MRNFLAKLGGRKFIMAVFGALAIALHGALGINEDAVLAIGGIVSAYVLGQGVADGLSAGRTSSVTELEPPGRD
ncbi:MAG: hypothetical protein M5U26_16775 [Planctomycetota bacterium]|nr:hypothetical protein [Planctomycetota bacterium]